MNIAMATLNSPLGIINGTSGEPKLSSSSNHVTRTDQQQWWELISFPLIALMHKAGYSKEQQTKYVTFVFENLVSFLGPAPSPGNLPHFDSFCNDDFSPVELSWNVQKETSTVRIGFEPIGQRAGTPRDPFNALQLERVLSHLFRRDPRVKVELWQHFKNDFAVVTEKAPAFVAHMASNEHMSSNTISFDLVGDPLPKVYFYPIATAIAQNEFRGELVARSLESMERLHVNIKPALDVVRAYVAQAKASHGDTFLRLECLSCDAVEPVHSRFKLYIRTPFTSLKITKEVLTLGGRLGSDDVEACLANLCSFWRSALQSDDDESELPWSDHRTAGIVFNFEIHHDDPVPRSKVYIPVRHYGGTDLKIAQGLGRFFDQLGWSQLAESYVQDVQRIFPAQDFSQTIGRHSYVGLSHTESGPYVTVYYNLMTFSTGMEQREDGKLIGPASKRQRHLI